MRTTETTRKAKSREERVFTIVPSKGKRSGWEYGASRLPEKGGGKKILPEPKIKGGCWNIALVGGYWGEGFFTVRAFRRGGLAFGIKAAWLET